MIKKILCPIDGSPQSLEAVRYAAPLSVVHSAVLVIYFAQPKEPVAYFSGLITDPIGESQYQSHIQSQVQQHFQEALAIVAKHQAKAETLSTITESPAHAIVACAIEQGCDLIVMASHGRGGMETLLLGSVTQKVLSHTQIPVLVVRIR